ncbi:MerR family transcriptional regulator [Ktedonosporobacter rubrisoli]|uniref:MerR family transcriptional regulator n=1 Tax=Ktedonosporobacter rubrisoli TaxID=2509675 RepID=A0A4P6JJS9_KTERU|nr:MerR family transcriptional regulator [Ktedonosporobacter rubrisoli]QBD75293.1 MerR family transcriptional regulator [Ktedonosporobacter rubrisoli]
MYSVGALSKATNITIRTLHYYDELGLLKPSRVTEAGYRYYADEAIMQLHQITALKKLGFTLAQIKKILAEEESQSKEERWKHSLHLQLQAIEEEKQRLDHLEQLLYITLNAIEMTGEIKPDDIFMFIKALRTDTRTRQEFFARHFSEDETRIITNLPNLATNDPRVKVWAKLLREIREHLHEPPDSPVAQELARRVIECSEEFFQGNEELTNKYWSLIRPEQGESARVFGLDRETMDYIDQIVDWYLAHYEEPSPEQ